jgi:hypothetical protein
MTVQWQVTCPKPEEPAQAIVKQAVDVVLGRVILTLVLWNSESNAAIV